MGIDSNLDLPLHLADSVQLAGEAFQEPSYELSGDLQRIVHNERHLSLVRVHPICGRSLVPIHCGLVHDRSHHTQYRGQHGCHGLCLIQKSQANNHLTKIKVQGMEGSETSSLQRTHGKDSIHRTDTNSIDVARVIKEGEER